jgi:hypothetical protein
VGLASGTAPEDFGGTMLRLLAYMAGLPFSASWA